MTRQTKRNQRFFRAIIICMVQKQSSYDLYSAYVDGEMEGTIASYFFFPFAGKMNQQQQTRHKKSNVSKRREQEKIQVLHVAPIMVFFPHRLFVSALTVPESHRLTHISVQDSSGNNSGFMLLEKNTTDKMPLIHFVWLEKVCVCVCALFFSFSFFSYFVKK